MIYNKNLTDFEVTNSLDTIKLLVEEQKEKISKIWDDLKLEKHKLISLENIYIMASNSLSKDLEDQIDTSKFTSVITPTKEFIDILGNKEIN